MSTATKKTPEQSRKENLLILTIVAVILLALAITIVVIIANGNKGNQLEGYNNSDAPTNYVRMNISYTDKSGKACTGDIVIQLRPDMAPATVENFQNLVGKKFYDNVPFHRVMESFMIQGGDPDGDGISSSDETTIKGEFSANGFTSNELLHNRGTISMARLGNNYNSASTQFFIVTKESANNHASLDGQYAAFGYVIYGMDTIDGIAATPVEWNDYGTERSVPKYPVTINFARFVTPESTEGTQG